MNIHMHIHIHSYIQILMHRHPLWGKMVGYGLKKPVTDVQPGTGSANKSPPQFMLDADDKGFNSTGGSSQQNAAISVANKSQQTPAFFLDADDKMPGTGTASPAMDSVSVGAPSSQSKADTPAAAGALSGLAPHIASAEQTCMEFQVG
jgi:hypothetical protein